MPGPRPHVANGVDVEGLLREARRALDVLDSPPTPDDNAGVPAVAAAGADGRPAGGCSAEDIALLRQLLVKDPHRISVKHDYHILRSVISGCWGLRHSDGADDGVPAGAATEGQVLVLALVLAARLPLDGLLLAAQALYHALPDTLALALLRTLAQDPGWKDSAVLALHHGLLAVAVSLVPCLDEEGGAEQTTRRPGQPSVAGPGLRRAVVDAVLGATIKCTLRECRATSHRTKAAFKMLLAYLCTVTRWRRVPAELDEIVMLVSTSWEVPLPGVRESNEAVLVQLQHMAVQSAAWPRPSESVAEAEAVVEALRRIRDTAGRWAAVLHATSWRSKDKYLQLKVLAPHLGRAALLCDMDAVLMEGLLLGTADPHLASAATAVYRVILAAIDVDAWHGHCFKHVTQALAARDRKLVINVLNYWVSPTVKAFPSTLPSLLAAMKGPMDAAMAGDRAHEHTFAHAAFLHLLKIGRKEGFWDPLDPAPEVSEYWAAVQWGLRHGDTWVRGVAFAAACVSARPRQPVSARELEAAMRFLDANVRSDDTRLRHSLLESLGWLLMRVRTSLRTLLALPGGDAEDNAELAAAARFLADLHLFVLDGLQPGANYQRRATCLGVYRLMLSYLSPEPGQPGQPAAASAIGLKKGVSKDPMPRSAVVSRHLCLGSAAARRVLLNCIMDPTDDVRAKAAEVLAMLPADAAGRRGRRGRCPRRPRPADLGPRAGAVQQPSLLPGREWRGAGRRAVHRHVEPMDLVAACERQLAALRADVLSAASEGSPLHGLLGLVRRLLPARSAQGKREAGRWAGAEGRLLGLLEDNVDLCLNLLACRASSDSAFAPSFAEMGEAIDSMVSRPSSDVEVADEEALPLTLSPAHQLVLNCIWLNLKASCALASDLAEVDFPGLVQSCSRRDFAERCARLSVVVLTRCRHKGAIEAAGTALQQVVRTLTEQADLALRRLPHTLLMEFMSLLLEGSTAKGTSVSRRSAGMAILVHRVVLGDQQPDKPLLHDCISCLFELLGCNVSQSALEGAQHDLPQTQALHFLRTLVADASLRVAMSPYVCQAALFCFRHLNSPVWSIRNASLQLFGALVPKIVGQGKSSNDAEEEDDTLVGCISFGDLVVRFNPLCNLLLEILKSVPAEGNVLKNQAELIPALSLLARLSVSELVPWLEGEYKCVKSSFLQLLSSPISVVRSLAAKAFSRFTPLVGSASAFEELLEILLKQSSTENGRNGILTAMKLIKEYINLEGQLTQAAISEKEKMSYLIRNKMNNCNWNLLSYASQAIVLSILEVQTNLENVETSLQILSKISSVTGQTNIGITQWVSANMRHIVTDCKIEALPTILNKSLGLPSSTDVPRAAALYVHRRLNRNVSTTAMQEILNVCMNNLGSTSTLSNYETFHVLNIILKIIVIVSDRQATLVCDMDKVTQISQDLSSSKLGARCKAITLPILAGLIMFLVSNWTMQEGQITILIMEIFLEDWQILCKSIVCLIMMKTTGLLLQQLRFAGTVVQHRRHLSPNQEESEENIKSETTSLILHTAIRLLQDEDSQVRDEASKFVTYLFQAVPRTLNSLECLEVLLTCEFLCLFLGSNQNVVRFLWQFLSIEDLNLSLSKDNYIENPFDHGSKNIFSEEIWILEKAGRSLTTIKKQNLGMETFSLTINEPPIATTQLQRNLSSLETLGQCKSDKRGSVRENWLAAAMCLQMRKINFRLDLLSKDINSECVTLHKKMCNVSNFTFYL
ncbi:LOW QUALITY PROTEIN: thyroid adenoma-associated protein homolog [Thrips palmi]|uniref:LOW QUALITY PROTEIN: thyroid adenoma-associated protein homolog n=1 Tax=Thrips palmi TaxID=161013 RepID=A0A6P8YUJ3_THRPL|nr:LOW QUALITY PROTEIN: thyroid adenoma-associated protein homolog [Thrips palmi]